MTRAGLVHRPLWPWPPWPYRGPTGPHIIILFTISYESVEYESTPNITWAYGALPVTISFHS